MIIHQPENQPDRLLTRRELELLLNLSRATIYRRQTEDSRFPQRIRLLGGRAVRWRLSEALAYIRASQDAGV